MHCSDFLCCRVRAVGYVGSSSMWDLSRSEIEPGSPELVGGFLTTGAPGKSILASSFNHVPRIVGITSCYPACSFHSTFGTCSTHAIPSIVVHAQLCPTLCSPMDCSLPGSSVHGISQARILEWVAISYPRASSQPRDRTCIFCVSCIGRQILYHWATGEARRNIQPLIKYNSGINV